ncbi:TIR domain-containing protein [Aliivibrio wodanis]|uniref:TIR domain-containing protein n=1 Tax=Aliivibrio wodanis TaxID=80852 RepID=UPI00406CE8A7
MAKRVFFSFHYQDVIDFRVNVVRNHKLTKDDNAGYFDASIWEDAKKESDLALKRLINKELQNTSVTCVLIGSHTFERRWVDYEIMKSVSRGNKLIGIHINNIKGKDGKTKSKGNNPFYYLGYSYDSTGKKLSLHNFINGKWVKYSDLDGWNVSEVEESRRNKIYRLSTIYSIYDWVDDDGYNNFSDWVK